MSRRCELSGKGVLTGNRVSHSNIKTRRRYLPNLNPVTLESETLGRHFRFRIAVSTLRSVDHRGGLDAYLAKARDEDLSPGALKVKKEIAKAQATV
ncbi:MAG: 50S ribosomal protein L28 [Paracoccaceae bacterium]